MEAYPRKDEGCPQLLDLTPKNGWWLVKCADETSSHGMVSEEKKLELRLGPPGGDWTISKERTHDSESPLGFVHFSNIPSVQNPVQRQTMASFLHLPSVHPQQPPVTERVPSEGFGDRSIAPANTTVPNSSSAQKRTAPQVVGWPPIRSFRKNLASGGASKLSSPNGIRDKHSGLEQNVKPPKSSSFVKINMDGVPIGRKVDLNAYHSYEKLSLAVNELFKGFLAAQNDYCGNGIKNDEEGGNVASGGCLLDERGEYTLVYEDNEGDRMLVGDVPWCMFVSTVKRLRVLKSSELQTLSLGSRLGRHPTS